MLTYSYCIIVYTVLSINKCTGGPADQLLQLVRTSVNSNFALFLHSAASLCTTCYSNTKYFEVPITPLATSCICRTKTQTLVFTSNETLIAFASQLTSGCDKQHIRKSFASVPLHVKLVKYYHTDPRDATISPVIQEKKMTETTQGPTTERPTYNKFSLISKLLHDLGLTTVRTGT